VTSDMIGAPAVQDVPRFCVERNGVARTKMMSRAWELLRDNPGGTILDVGCGDSRMWEGFLEAMPGVEYYGVEPFAGAVDRARARLPKHADRIKVGRGEKIGGLFGRRFDVVVSRSVLEHVVRRADFINAISSVVEPDGVILMTWGGGHFRQGFKTDIRNFASQALARLGYDRYYASPVDEAKAMADIGRNGMVVRERAQLNIEQVKAAHKLMTNPESRDVCMLLWLALEESLHRDVADKKYLSRMASETYLEIAYPESS
jgi:SAM-dependent methyltransferase